ncbi:MAG: NAD(P)/FAD-dependent oxidoreductase [Firmicutes bacterium]|nr:NAD(P)/FAD-dependent oxidoreductase [Bacillota bacterium]
MRTSFDAVVIGAGAVGCAVARELSGRGLRTAVLEREADVAFGNSGRNSGVVHTGFNNEPGSLKAALCREGSEGFEKLAEKLGIGYRKTGKLVVGSTPKDLDTLRRLKKQGETNEIPELEILTEEKIGTLEPAIRGRYALWSGRTAVFDPFEYTLALAEDAAVRGACFLFGHEVESLTKEEEDTVIKAGTYNGETIEITAGIVINAAGLFSPEIRKMAGDDSYTIRPCRGEYHLLEKGTFGGLSRPVYPVPDKEKGVLGIHLTPTLHGNLMIGPSAEFTEDPEDMAATAPVMAELLEGARCLLGDKVPLKVIRSFSGVRPKLTDLEGWPVEDFVIENDPAWPGLIHLMGIESPGITASVPIAGLAAEMLLQEGLIGRGARMEFRDRNTMFPAVSKAVRGKMICRCETVTEGEILQALENLKCLGAIPTLKGIKNRTRASMGSCQGGFCTLDMSRLFSEKAGIPTDRLTYNGPGSELFPGFLKGGAVHD